MGVRLVLERLEDRLGPAILTPTFSGLTSQTISYGTTVSLSGVVSATVFFPVPAGESVSIAFSNSTLVAHATTVSGGRFQVNVSTFTLSVSAYTIRYTYSGDANFNGASDSSTTLTVVKAQPTFSGLTASQTITYGTASVSLSGVLNVDSSRPVPALDTVVIDLGNPNDSVTATIGFAGTFQANLPTSDVAAGVYTIRYTFLGEANFNATSDTSTTLTVNKAQAALGGLTATPTITFGTASVSLSGVLNAGSSVPVPAGETVTIDLANTSDSVTATIGVGGSFQADLPTSDLVVGAYGIQYTYPGDANFIGTGDTSTTLTVAKVQPTFSGLAALQSVTYSTAATVIVSGVLNNVPLGTTVSIDLGSPEPTATAFTIAGGQFQAVLPTISTMPAGTYPIRYSYAGNSNYNSASDTSTTLTVTKLQTAFSDLQASQTIAYGTLSVVVSGMLDVPAGEAVTIDLGSGNPAVSTVTIPGGHFQTALPTSSVNVSVNNIRYTYLGDSNFSGTTDSSTMLTVTKAQPTFSGLIAKPTITYGTASVLLQGVLSAGPSAPVRPGETVTIDLGDAKHIVNATTIAGGVFQANLPTSDLPVATYAIRYTYLGNNNVNGTTDTTTSILTVTKAQPTFSGLIAQPTITYGNASVLLSGVLSAGPSVPVPAGESVRIDLGDSKHIVTAKIGNGGSFQANLATGDLPAAAYGIRYSYVGDSNFLSATDTSTTLTVNKAQPTFSGLAAAQTLVNGAPTAIMSGVLNAGSSLPVPAGETVSIASSDNGVTATMTTKGSFQANLPETNLGAPSYTISFTYAGDRNFNSSSAMLVITEPPAATSTTIVPVAAELRRATTVTAIVANVQGQYAPPGAVQFLVDGNAAGGPVPLVNGSASVSVGPYLVVATHRITASYLPANTLFLASTGTLTLPVIRNLQVLITPPPPLTLYSTNPYVFQVNYANVGAEASTAILTETVPANATFNAAASDAGWTTVDHRHYTLNLGVLNSGEAGVVAFAVNVHAKGTVTISDTAAIWFDLASRSPVSTSTGSTKVLFGRRFGN
jgi:hypothetical protein